LVCFLLGLLLSTQVLGDALQHEAVVLDVFGQVFDDVWVEVFELRSGQQALPEGGHFFLAADFVCQSVYVGFFLFLPVFYPLVDVLPESACATCC